MGHGVKLDWPPETMRQRAMVWLRRGKWEEAARILAATHSWGRARRRPRRRPRRTAPSAVTPIRKSANNTQCIKVNTKL